MTTELRGWFEAEPWHTSRELFKRLQAQCPGVYPDGQLRTLQRRLKEWRREAAHRMVFGTMTADAGVAAGDGEELHLAPARDQCRGQDEVALDFGRDHPQPMVGTGASDSPYPSPACGVGGGVRRRDMQLL